MSITLPNGTKTSIASAYDDAEVVSAITNANPAVASSTGHSRNNGDVIEINSGWSALDGRIVRVANVTANTFELEGIDTTNVNNYPPGSGAGSVRAITAWTQLTQIMGRQASGGEPSFYTFKFEEDPSNTERQIRTGKSAKAITINLGNDPSKPWNSVLVAADQDGENRAVRHVFPNNAIQYLNANVAYDDVASMSSDEAMQNTLTLSLQSAPTRYNS